MALSGQCTVLQRGGKSKNQCFQILIKYAFLCSKWRITLEKVQNWSFNSFKSAYSRRTQLTGDPTRSKNFKTPFFSRYHKFLPRGNSIRSRTSPKFFSTNMVARGVLSFGILEGATGPLIEQWLKFFVQFSPDIW